MEIKVSITESTHWDFAQIEQGGWIAINTIGEYPNYKKTYLFAEDFDKLCEKLKVQLVVEKMDK